MALGEEALCQYLPSQFPPGKFPLGLKFAVNRQCFPFYSPKLARATNRASAVVEGGMRKL